MASRCGGMAAVTATAPSAVTGSLPPASAAAAGGSSGKTGSGASGSGSGSGGGLVLRAGSSSGSGGAVGLGVGMGGPSRGDTGGAVTSAVALKASEVAKLRDKVIIVTGALLPERFADSDAPLNVGAAVCAVGLLPPGVYVCMQGQVFDPDGVDRVVANGCFVAREVGGAASDSDSD